MAHYCRICGCCRPNESFSGKGHRAHICKKCKRLPREIRYRIETLDVLDGFLHQSNISAKNIRYLELLAQHEDPAIFELASIVLAIGEVHPRRRKRYRRIRTDHPELWQRMLEHGIVEDWDLDGELAQSEDWTASTEDGPFLEAPDSDAAGNAGSEESFEDDIPF